MNLRKTEKKYFSALQSLSAFDTMLVNQMRYVSTVSSDSLLPPDLENAKAGLTFRDQNEA